MARIELVEETKMNLQSQSSKPTDEKDRTEPITINSDDNNSDDKK